MGMPGWDESQNLPPVIPLEPMEEEWVLYLTDNDEFGIPVRYRPNVFRRFCLWFLLGWKFKRNTMLRVSLSDRHAPQSGQPETPHTADGAAVQGLGGEPASTG